MPYVTEDGQGEGSSSWGVWVSTSFLVPFKRCLHNHYHWDRPWNEHLFSDYQTLVPWSSNLCTLVSLHHTLACSSWLQTSSPRFHVTKIQHPHGALTRFVTLLHRTSLFCTICHNSPLKWLLLMVNYCNFVECKKNDCFMILWPRVAWWAIAN